MIESSMLYIAIAITAVVAIATGFLIGKQSAGKKTEQEKEIAEKEAVKIIESAKKEADSLKRDKLLEAKELMIQQKAEHEKDISQRTRGMEQKESSYKQKEQSLNQKIENATRKETENDTIRENMNRQLELVQIKKAELDKSNEEHVRKLEGIAKLTAVEAKQQLIESLKDAAKAEALKYEKEYLDEAKVRANKEAKKVIINTIQRTAAEHAIENTVSVFHIESDDIKGQIIGREGRNIKALEAATGVEIIVDDTPEAIVISGFDPVRREIARLSLQRLVADGRIHPARIEEIVEKTKKQLEDQIMEIGERTIIELGIHGMQRELVRMVGRMRFRSSYGQNLLQHSKEVANLCAVMASELGINPKMAKRAGLLHDIGKVPDKETELSHALLGAKIAEEFGESPAIVNAIGAHHDEMEMQYVISPIIQACDSISGARPGARREMMESYLKRLKDLEALAMSYEGVEKAYAIQAGRELRVIVEADKIQDKQAEELSFTMAQKIEKEMTYPGQVKVTVIREKRAVNFAR